MVIGIFCLYQLDHYYDLAKDISENASASSVIYTEENIKDGEVIYKAAEVDKSIRNTIDDFLGITNLQYTSDYQKYFIEDNVNYKFYLLNSNGEMNEYENGLFLKTTNITFPYDYKDSQINYNRMIHKPTVIVTVDMGTLKNNYFNTRIIRSSAYIKTEIGE
jgi:hypothetical protein